MYNLHETGNCKVKATLVIAELHVEQGCSPGVSLVCVCVLLMYRKIIRFDSCLLCHGHTEQAAWVKNILGIQISLSASETCVVKATGQCKQLA